MWLLLYRGSEALDDEEDFYYTEVEASSTSSSSASSLSSSPVPELSSAVDAARSEAMFSSPIAMDHDYQRKVRLPISTPLVSEFCASSALTLLVGRQEGHPACKKLSGGVLAWLSSRPISFGWVKAKMSPLSGGR